MADWIGVDVHDVTVTCACGRAMTPVNTLGPNHFRCAKCRTRVRVDSPLFHFDPKRCRWASETPCPREAVEHFPVCEEHMIAAARAAVTRPETRHALVEQYEENEFWHALVTAEKRMFADRAARAESARQTRDQLYPPVNVVYYVRLSPDNIKIGTTAYLAHRMLALRVHDDAQILAAEPGDRKLEKQRHREFAELRYHTHREDFRPGDALMRHIERVREEHGKPYELVARLLADR